MDPMWQVLPMVGAEALFLDSLFSSSSTPNPLLGAAAGFLPSSSYSFSAMDVLKEERGMGMMMMMRSKEEEMESGSGSGHLGGGSCDEEQSNGAPPQHPHLLHTGAKRKRYHRHTAPQIQEMEALFKKCPHPDDKQRMGLSQELGLKPRQVKFWFQNRRTQMKTQHDRTNNVVLREENESLKADNFRLQAAVRNVVCPTCGSAAIIHEISLEEQHLRIENARLKEELECLSSIVARYGNRTLQHFGPSQPKMLLSSLDLNMSIYSRHFTTPSMGGCTDLRPTPTINKEDTTLFHGMRIMDQDKPLTMDLAMTVADHIVRSSGTNESL